MTSGQISTSEASGIVELFEHRRRIIETENLETRIRALEQKMAAKKDA
jgi:hypothetical protein